MILFIFALQICYIYLFVVLKNVLLSTMLYTADCDFLLLILTLLINFHKIYLNK